MGDVTYFGKSDLIRIRPGWVLSEDKFGLMTGRVEFQIKPGRWDLIPKKNSPHPYALFCAMERRTLQSAKGWWLVAADYAGAEEDSEPEYALEIGENREPIETHKDFVAKIGGKPSAPLNGAIFVDDTGHPTSDDLLGSFDRFRMVVDGARNDLAGTTAYEAANQTTWVKSWTSKSRPTDAGVVGFIDNPEGVPPTFHDGRNWRYAGLSSVRRGHAYSNRKLWKLSGPGGWNPKVYTP